MPIRRSPSIPQSPKTHTSKRNDGGGAPGPKFPPPPPPPTPPARPPVKK